MLEYFTIESGGVNRSIWLLLLQAAIQNASAEASEKAMYFTDVKFPSNVPTVSLPTHCRRQTQKVVNKLNDGRRVVFSPYAIKMIARFAKDTDFSIGQSADISHEDVIIGKGVASLVE